MCFVVICHSALQLVCDDSVEKNFPDMKLTWHEVILAGYAQNSLVNFCSDDAPGILYAHEIALKTVCRGSLYFTSLRLSRSNQLALV